MEDLVKLGSMTYYIPGKTNIGLIMKDNKVVLIDSGNDKDAGRKLRQILDKNNLTIDYILNTHSNADHIGANAYLMNQYNCASYAYKREMIFCEYTELEASFLYGGFPTKKMQNKFLKAKPCQISDIEGKQDLDVEWFELGGHFFDMIGFKTQDNVYFLADSLFPKDIIDKYHIFYILDVAKFLKTLDNLLKLNEKNEAIFVSSHCEMTNDISSLVELNRNKIFEIIDLLKEICKTKISFDNLLKKVFDNYSLVLDLNQYLLVGSTIRNYLSYLEEEKLIEFIFEENTLYYKTQ